MTASVFEIPGQGHRAVCEDPACLSVLLRPWRSSGIATKVRAASLAADHNRTRHGAR